MPIFGSAAANKLAKQNTNAAAPKIRMVAVAENRSTSTTKRSVSRAAIPTHPPRSLNGAPKGKPPKPEIRTKNKEKKDVITTIKNSTIRRASPATPPASRLHSDDEGEDSEEELNRPNKKRKTGSDNGVQVTRQIKDLEAFQPGPPRSAQIVHMEDIANIGTAHEPNDAYVPLFMALAGDEEEAPTVAPISKLAVRKVPARCAQN